MGLSSSIIDLLLLLLVESAFADDCCYTRYGGRKYKENVLHCVSIDWTQHLTRGRAEARRMRDVGSVPLCGIAARLHPFPILSHRCVGFDHGRGEDDWWFK